MGSIGTANAYYQSVGGLLSGEDTVAICDSVGNEDGSSRGVM